MITRTFQFTKAATPSSESQSQVTTAMKEGGGDDEAEKNPEPIVNSEPLKVKIFPMFFFLFSSAIYIGWSGCSKEKYLLLRME